MRNSLRFPIRIKIRIKILVTLLFLVTGVVGTITFAMAHLFHQDKKMYVNDLAAATALSTAEECESLLQGYHERLQVYARVIEEPTLSRESKSGLLGKFFEDFPELVAITVSRDGEEQLSAYNSAALEVAKLEQSDFKARRLQHPLPLDELRQNEVYLRNSTLTDSLPTMTLAVALDDERADSGVTIVAAEIALHRLDRLAQRARGFRVFIADADGVYLAHRDRTKVSAKAHANLDPRVAAAHGEHSAGTVLEYTSEDGTAMIGGFAGVRLGHVLAGVELPTSAANLTARKLLGMLLLVALGLLLLSTAIGLIWAHRLTRPIEELSEATREIAKGDFGFSVEVKSGDEIGALAGSFNAMSSELKDRETALQEAQIALVQSEKMAAFGQLGAGIAHEVKNPLAGILGCAQLSLRKVEKDSPLETNLKLIEKETRRCKTIIENLLRFARQEKAVLEPIQINPVVEDAMAIVSHQLEMNQVLLERDLAANLPAIHGNANQLQQVLMNLMINAQQAMEGAKGTVRITTSLIEDGRVLIEVVDDGPGMTAEVRQKLFEPFFTTKPGGKGTGLGLSVSFGIVKDHRGEIEVESEQGQGARFTITLPTLSEHRSAQELSA